MLRDVKAGRALQSKGGLPGLHAFALGKVTAGTSGTDKVKGFMPTINQLIRKGRTAEGQVEGPCDGAEPAEARRLHPCLYDDSEEAELGASDRKSVV